MKMTEYRKTYLTYSKHFRAIQEGKKRFEWLKRDDSIYIGQTLELIETEDGTEKDTGAIILVVVTDIMYGGEYDIPENRMILSIKLVF